ncbi:putative capsid protein [Sewage-associated circular DNA virus-15]|uniref:putative capsid protein n=1 Tax=Sewage-associated circular DNA virus-15 TaxID=1592082 RepID=UPI0005860462|nr:putative capsid protein [Sewage-associated circular DNA virus-15]AJD07523.1 putative capsid protein [Sewage-associated circular DNA virus-15]
MPKLVKKTYPRKKNVRRRRVAKHRTVNVNRALQPFAQRYITKMKYSEAYTLNAGNIWSQIMNLNSIFDPNRTGIGHQPYGHDTLQQIYGRYRVISCKYVVNCYNATTPIRFGCLPANEIPPVSTVSELCENPRSQFRIQFPGGSTQTIAGVVSIPSLVGRNKSQYMADDRFQAPFGSSPAELALLYITGQSMADSNVDINLNVTLEYLVECFDVIPLEQS